MHGQVSECCHIRHNCHPHLAAHLLVAVPRLWTREQRQRTEVHLQPGYDTLNVFWFLLQRTSTVLQALENLLQILEIAHSSIHRYLLNAVKYKAIGEGGQEENKSFPLPSPKINGNSKWTQMTPPIHRLQPPKMRIFSLCSQWRENTSTYLIHPRYLAAEDRKTPWRWPLFPIHINGSIFSLTSLCLSVGHRSLTLGAWHHVTSLDVSTLS